MIHSLYLWWRWTLKGRLALSGMRGELHTEIDILRKRVMDLEASVDTERLDRIERGILDVQAAYEREISELRERMDGRAAHTRPRRSFAAMVAIAEAGAKRPQSA